MIIERTLEPPAGCKEAVHVLIERPEVEDYLWVSRTASEVNITVTMDCDERTMIVDYPMFPDEARIVARELLRLASEIDGKEPTA